MAKRTHAQVYRSIVSITGLEHSDRTAIPTQPFPGRETKWEGGAARCSGERRPEGLKFRQRYQMLWWPFAIALSRIVLGVMVDHLLLITFPQGPWGIKVAGFNWVSGFLHWDANWYNIVVETGYSSLQSTAFFPGYPLLVKCITTIGVPFSYASLFSSWTCFVAAAALLFKLISARFGEAPAVLSTLMFCWSPQSVFLISPYSESLFALTTVLFLLSLDIKGKYGSYLCVLFAALASAQRFPGTLFAVSLVISRIVESRRSLRAGKIVRLMVMGVIGELGALAYMVYLYVKFKNPLSFMAAEHYWGRVLTVPFWTVLVSMKNMVLHPGGLGGNVNGAVFLNGNVYTVFLMDDAMAVLGIVATVLMVIRKDLPLNWTILSVFLLVVSVVTSPGGSSPESIGRYIMVILPLYPAIVLGTKRQLLVGGIIPAFIAFAIVGQFLFNLGYWFT